MEVLDSDINHHDAINATKKLPTMTTLSRRAVVAGLAIGILFHSANAFVPSIHGKTPVSAPLQLASDDNVEGKNDDSSSISRRQALSLGVTSTASIVAGLSQEAAATEDGVFRPAKRPTAYIVDSTIPPTLLPLNARKEIAILTALGKGSGTNKGAIVDDSVNLNNILNKAVFGTIDAIATVTGTSGKEDVKSGPGYASFVCLGLPKETRPVDVDLATGLLEPMFQVRKSFKAETALGIAFAPLSTQSALDAYSQDGNSAALIEAMTSAGVAESEVQLYIPVFQLAKSRKVKLLALAPEVADAQTVRTRGLQNVDPESRAKYVADAQGFIALTQDPKFKLYTDKSLLKDFEPVDAKDQQGNFFAQRILVHETAATVLANYAVSRPDSFVAVIAPTPDVRYLEGINGRIPRVCQFLNKEENKVTDDAVTTILLNPTAKVSFALSCAMCLFITASYLCRFILMLLILIHSQRSTRKRYPCLATCGLKLELRLKTLTIKQRWPITCGSRPCPKST